MDGIDWNKVLIDASIAAMQGIQESGKFGIALDVMPEKLAEVSIKIAKSMVNELKNTITQNKQVTNG